MTSMTTQATTMSFAHQFLFGIYPYIAAALFLFGSLARFEREQYSWKADSSQLLYRGNLRLGSILFHVGILGLFFGPSGGPAHALAVWDALGVSHSLKQTAVGRWAPAGSWARSA